MGFRVVTSWRPPDRVLRVHLAERSVESEPIPSAWRRRFLGGKGLGARYLYELVDPGTDPLGPDNVLAVMLGPLSGYLPGETRYAAITTSPLTGIFLDSYAGGSFPRALVGALDGHLGLLIDGRASEPVRVHVEDGTAWIESAADWWGLDAVEVADEVSEGAVAGPGPAGETGVRYATIASDGGNHQAGRGGTGAVMGAKRLKAIVAVGDVPDVSTLATVRDRYQQRFEEDPRGDWHRSGGTVETVDAADAAGVLPTEGWRSGSFEGAERIGIDAIRERTRHREGDEGGVPGDFELDEGTVPRGALAISLGANIGLDDFDDIATLGTICDRLGMDVIEAGNAIAWAMVGSEAGIIDRAVEMGDATAAAALLREIAHRSTELGDTLARGIDAAVAAYGGDELVPTIKAMAAATYDPRPAPGMALAYATSDRGACHRRARPVFEEVLDGTDWTDDRRVQAVRREQDRRSLLWCFIVDDVTAPAFEGDLGRGFLEAAGLTYTEAELRRLGERVWTLTRLFNVREGVSREDDALPAPFTRPLGDGPTAGAAIEPSAFHGLLDRYYEARRWGSDGRPSRELLEDLNLLETVDETTPIAEEPITRSAE